MFNIITRLFKKKSSAIKSQIYIFDSNNFSNLEDFLIESEKVLTNNFKSGRNLNAFNDILRGGFGKFDYEEPITIVWKNHEKSKKDLSEELFNDIVGYIKKKPHITFNLK